MENAQSIMDIFSNVGVMIGMILVIPCIIGLVVFLNPEILPLLPKALICAFMVILPLIIFPLLSEGGSSWSEFSRQHNCKVTERVQGEHQGGIGFVGNRVGAFSSSGSDRTTWICDDGVTYVRND